MTVQELKQKQYMKKSDVTYISHNIIVSMLQRVNKPIVMSFEKKVNNL